MGCLEPASKHCPGGSPRTDAEEEKGQQRQRVRAEPPAECAGCRLWIFHACGFGMGLVRELCLACVASWEFVHNDDGLEL